MDKRNLLIVGLNPTSKKLIDYFVSQPDSIRIIAVMIFQKTEAIDVFPFPVVIYHKHVFDSTILKSCHEVYSTMLPNDLNNLLNLSEICRSRGFRLHWVSRFDELIPYPIHLQNMHGFSVFSELQEPLQHFTNRILKRSFDVLLSSTLIICCLTWMIPFLGLMICITSRGPIFFCQKRTGINNKSFTCLKFRTMCINHEAHQIQAKKHDMRVTKLGKILRRTSLDEFPQLINVWLGDMSLVGPRPHMLQHTKEFTSSYASYKIRHYVKPGITGWSQINGFRGEIITKDQLKERIARDFWYIEHWSFWLDLKILFKTGKKMFTGDQQAY